jgi:hypothetical protein
MLDGRLAAIDDLPGDFGERFRAHQYADGPVGPNDALPDQGHVSVQWSAERGMLLRLREDARQVGRVGCVSAAVVLQQFAQGEHPHLAGLSTGDRAAVQHLAAELVSTLPAGLLRPETPAPTSPPAPVSRPRRRAPGAHRRPEPTPSSLPVSNPVSVWGKPGQTLPPERVLAGVARRTAAEPTAEFHPAAAEPTVDLGATAAIATVDRRPGLDSDATQPISYESAGHAAGADDTAVLPGLGTEVTQRIPRLDDPTEVFFARSGALQT